jgi:hypothetical protein
MKAGGWGLVSRCGHVGHEGRELDGGERREVELRPLHQLERHLGE